MQPRTAPPASPSTPQLPAAQRHIESKMPGWLTTHTPEKIKYSRAKTHAYLPWYEQACKNMPEVVKAFHDEQALYRQTERSLSTLLAPLPSLEDFAEPLLKKALQEHFQLDVDVRRTVLYKPRLVVTPHDSSMPGLSLYFARQRATFSLLTAALHNFSAAETQLGAMDSSDHGKAEIYYQTHPEAASKYIADYHGETLEIPPHQFAELARVLDLGGQYQRLFTAVFNPSGGTHLPPSSTATNLALQLQASENHLLRLHTHRAYMTQAIGKAMYDSLLDLTAIRHTGGDVLSAYHLSMREIRLVGIVAFGRSLEESSTPVPIVVYAPEDPICPLKEYASTREFVEHLRSRMFIPGYLDAFRHHLLDQDASEAMSDLTARLKLEKWSWVKERKRWEIVPDKKARLHIRSEAYTGSFLLEFTTCKIRKLQMDALFHGAPTAQRDEQTLEASLLYIGEKVLQLMSFAAFVNPVAGAIMLGVTAMQLAYESYEAFECWARDEKAQALAYLLDVMENVAMFAMLGKAAAEAGSIPAIERIPVETPSFIEELQTVTLPNGEIRLAKPDITPFSHDIVLPSGLKPDAFGLYHYQGKTWLSFEDRYYALEPHPTGADGQFQIEPAKASIHYKPTFRHNGAGAWQHEFDYPLHWDGPTLTRRFGPVGEGFSPSTVQRILWISDTPETVLRQAFSEQQRPPALFQDTLQRFRIDQTLSQDFPGMDTASRVTYFQKAYQALLIDQSPGSDVIRRVYPDLPNTIVEELLRHATSAELDELQTGKVPLRLAEEIRVYQQQVRLARAYEGLYLDSGNQDTDRLVLHSVTRLPGWSEDVRLEIRQGSPAGQLIDHVGAQDAPLRKILARHANGYDCYDDQGHELNGRDTIYSSILHALPDAQRNALGFHGTWDGPLLKKRIQTDPLLPRNNLRQVLGMQPIKPWKRSPMRLADGRLGYTLSGRPSLESATLRMDLVYRIRLLGLERINETADQVLTALEEAGLSHAQIDARLLELEAERDALEQALNTWQDQAPALPDQDRRLIGRAQIQEALWQHWSSSNLPEIGRDSGTLRLVRVVLTDFPTELPDFVGLRTRQLQLIDIQALAQHSSDTSVADWRAEFDAIHRFITHFQHLTSLELRRLEQFPSRMLVDALAGGFPMLRELRLLELGAQLAFSEYKVAQLLNQLPELEVLDLSGSTLYQLVGESPIIRARLRYLGLNGMGLDTWPSWLNSEMVASIDHLSLNDNRIIRVPEHLRLEESADQTATRISLRNNPLTLRCLLTLLTRRTASRLEFDLSVPEPVQEAVNAFRQERQALLDVVDNWANGSTSTSVVDEQVRVARRQIGETLVEFLQAELTEETSLLRLNAIALEHFPPRLPDTFYPRVRHLNLQGVDYTDSQLDAFLRRFTALNALTLDGHVRPLESVPQALSALQQLRRLRLCNQDLVVDQRAMTLFANLPRLQWLDLEGNRLEATYDVEGLSNHLARLSLASTGLQAWPDWVEPLLPMDMLELDNNEITHLPEHILYNPRNDDGHTEISLRGNPLSYDTMYRAHTSDNGRRSYSFEMDLPEEVRVQEWRERHESDSEHSEYSSDSEHSHSPAVDEHLEEPDIEDWLLASAEENEVHREIWQALEAGGEAPALIELVGRLARTASYRNAATRTDFVARVWRILEIASNNAEDRQLFNGMAFAGVERNAQGLYETCHDGAWLVFNQMEIKVFTEQALRDLPGESRGQALYRLIQRLYRLEEVENIARARAGARDEAEVRMAYKLLLAEELDLPLPPKKMLYQSCANIARGELDEVLANVREGESGERFRTFAARQDAWVDYLKETYPERFDQLRQDYERRVLDAPEEHARPSAEGQPPTSPSIDELAPIIEALKKDYERQLTHLIEELTITEGYKYL